MPDNRISSINKYAVGSVASISTENNITKRPYSNIPTSHTKRENTSDSFNDTLDSASSHDSLNDNSETFSNELENALRLKSEENSRIVQAKFNDNTLTDSNFTKNNLETELHNKLSQAMDIEVDISIISRKIELLNSLKK